MSPQYNDPKSRAKRESLNRAWSLYKMYGEHGYGSGEVWWTHNQNESQKADAEKPSLPASGF